MTLEGRQIPAEPKSPSSLPIAAARPGGEPRFLPTVVEAPSATSSLEIRRWSGHRFVSDPVTTDDRCLGCGWDGLGKIIECRPGTPRCERCDQPADVTEFIGAERFDLCSEHRNADRERVRG